MRGGRRKRRQRRQASSEMREQGAPRACSCRRLRVPSVARLRGVRLCCRRLLACRRDARRAEPLSRGRGRGARGYPEAPSASAAEPRRRYAATCNGRACLLSTNSSSHRSSSSTSRRHTSSPRLRQPRHATPRAHRPSHSLPSLLAAALSTLRLARPLVPPRARARIEPSCFAPTSAAQCSPPLEERKRETPLSPSCALHTLSSALSPGASQLALRASTLPASQVRPACPVSVCLCLEVQTQAWTSAA